MVAGLQVPLLDPEDRACLDFDIADDAGPAGNVDEFGVISAGWHVGDAQTLVGVDGAVPVVLALVGTPIRAACRSQIKFRDRTLG